MKGSWTALAVSFLALLVVCGCNDYGNTFQNNTGALLTFLSPSQIQAGSGSFSMLANGSGFVAKTVVYWNGKALPTTVALDSNGNVLTVTATVAASLVANVSVAKIYTLNPQSGTGNNGLSNIVAFNINPPPNPAPILSPGGLSPNTSPASTSSTQNLAITLTGSGFIANADPTQASQVQWSEAGTLTNLQVGTVSSTSIQATIPVNLLVNTSASSVAASVTVFNPPAPPPPGCTTNCIGGGGGGSSNPLTFTICGAGQASCAPLAEAKDAASAAVAEETPAVSLDGRFVSFSAVQDGHPQVFLRDTCQGAPADCQARTSLLSVAADGSAANDESHSPSMSSDGRYVAFSSAATNLVENAAPGRQVYLRDTCAGAPNSCTPSTQVVSVDPNGALVGTESILPSVSSSGRFVAFLAVTPSLAVKSSMSAKALANVGDGSYRQVFVRDTCLGVANCTAKTTRISLQPGDGSQADAKTAGPALSGQASHVAVSGGTAATLFTRSVAVDDRVFLAITNGQH
jgi:hypothetical protein